MLHYTYSLFGSPNRILHWILATIQLVTRSQKYT